MRSIPIMHIGRAILLIGVCLAFVFAVLSSLPSSSLIFTYAQDVQCWNGGTVDPLTDQCHCQSGFTNQNCSALSCINGLTGKSIPPNSDNVCSCAPGWAGINCQMCTNDTVCRLSPADNTSYCSTDLLTQVEKQFDCQITNIIMATMMGDRFTFQCTNATDTTPGTCYLQVWDTEVVPGGNTENFYCTFSGCTTYVTQGSSGGLTVNYACQKSQCACTFLSPKCSSDPNAPGLAYSLYQTIQSMVGTATVTCPTSTTCTLNQEEVTKGWGMNIPVTCTAGECIYEYRPPPIPIPTPKNYFTMYALIALGTFIALLIGTIIICSVTLVVQTKRMSRLYHNMQTSSFKGATLSFKNLSYTMRTWDGKGFKTKKLLNNVSHTIEAGQVVAIMGPSGAGKTTLLDILANRNKRGKVTGEILINGKRPDASFKRISGYVFQDDILMSTLTVKECLMFAAKLRLPDCISREDKEKRVDEVLRELGIAHIANTKIGNEFTRGISGGEKRRVSIGMELISSPSILFLDEPTSGLDSWNAFSVVQSLVQLSKSGRTIVFSVHQPSSSIFEAFDQLMLVSRGRLVYAGPARDAVIYFSRQGVEFPPGFNPADVLIDVVARSEGRDASKSILSTSSDKGGERQPLLSGSAGTITPSVLNNRNLNLQSVRVAGGNFPPTDNDEAYYQQSYSALKGAGSNDGSDSPNTNGSIFFQLSDSTDGAYSPEYSTSYASQFLTLSHRSFQNFTRNLFLMPAHYAAAVVLGVLLGTVFYKSPLDLAGIQNRLGAIFFMFGVLAFGAIVSLEIFVSERSIYIRERANGYYYPSIYFFSKCLFDIIPLRVFPPIIMGSIMYWMIGMRATGEHFLWFLLVMVLFNLAASSLCLTIGAISPSVGAGNFTCIILIMFNMLFGGFMLNLKTLTPRLSWLKYTSIFFYGFEALAVNDLYNVNILINPPEGNIVPYDGQGEFILGLFGLEHNRFVLDIVMMFVLSFTYISAAALLLRFFVKERR